MPADPVLPHLSFRQYCKLVSICITAEHELDHKAELKGITETALILRGCEIEYSDVIENWDAKGPQLCLRDIASDTSNPPHTRNGCSNTQRWIHPHTNVRAWKTRLERLRGEGATFQEILYLSSLTC